MAADNRYHLMLRLEGAVSCLEELLDHCRAHTISIDEDIVFTYFLETKLNLLNLKQAYDLL